MRKDDFEALEEALSAAEAYFILVARRVIGAVHVPDEAMREARYQMVAAIDELASRSELAK
jgi:hypothetical protein